MKLLVVRSVGLGCCVWCREVVGVELQVSRVTYVSRMVAMCLKYTFMCTSVVVYLLGMGYRVLGAW